MATTVGTLAPIVPCAIGKGGTATSGVLATFPANADVFRLGDIAVLASGLADRVDNGHSDAVIVGVTVEPKATATTATSYITLALALPGAIFTGSLIASAGTDFTTSATPATAAASMSAAANDTVLNTDTYAPFICIDEGSASGQIRCVRFSNAQLGGRTFSLSVAYVNPRVDFVFRCSAFQPLV